MSATDRPISEPHRRAALARWAKTSPEARAANLAHEREVGYAKRRAATRILHAAEAAITAAGGTVTWPKAAR